MLPYIQLSPLTIKHPSFLQGALLRGVTGGGKYPPPAILPDMGVSHSVLFRGDTGLTYFCPKLVWRGIVRWRDFVVVGLVRLEHLEVREV